MKRWQILLVLLIVAFLPYSVALFSGQQLGPTEHIQTMVTPGSPEPTYGWDVLQADGVLQFLPWRDLVFDAWRKGEAPILNPYQLAGQPLLANSQSGGFYPLHILFAFLPGTTGLKILFLGILHLFVAGSGLFYFLRNLRVSESGSLLGATAFALSQFMVAWAPLASVPSTVAWIPWILAGVVCENRRTGFFQVAIATAMMLLAGHLQFAFYGMFAAGLVLIWQLATQRKAMALLPLAGLMVGIVVAIPQLGMVLNNSKTSHRQNVPSAEGYEGYKKGVLAPYEALSLVNPKLLGDTLTKPSDLYPPDEGDVKHTLLDSGYWPLAVKPGANPAEAALWISPIALSLALFGLFNWKKKDEDGPSALPAVLILVVGVLLAFGSPLNQLLFFNFPGWSATGSPGRAHVLIVLALCVLGAIGFHQFEAKNDGSKKWFAIAVLPLIALVVGFNSLGMLGGMVGASNGEYLSAVISASTKLHMGAIALSSLVASIVLLLIASKKLSKFAALPAMIVAATLIGQHPLSGKPLDVPTQTPDQERHIFVSRGWNMYTTPRATMPPNIASLARVHDLFGYDSILDKGFVEKLKAAIGGADPATPENGNLMMLRSKQDLQDNVASALHELGVKSVGGDSTDTRIQGGVIEYDGYDHQIIKPNADATEILVRDRYFDGMTSPTPNTTIENRDGWRLIKTDGKQTTIRIDYAGRKNYIGVIIGIAILIIGYALVVRKHESNPTEA